MNSLLVPGEALRVGEVITIARERFDERQSLEEGVPCRLVQWGGSRATGRVVALRPREVECEVEQVLQTLERAPIEAIVALPRPPTVRKVIQAAALLGVSHLHFVRTRNTEKSYLTSHALKPEAIRAEVILALEQGFDSTPLAVSVHDRFLPFIQDVLPKHSAFAQALRIVADGAGSALASVLALPPLAKPSAALFAVGPEAGWVPFELEQFAVRGFIPVALGPRILRVETACSVLATQLGWVLSGSPRELPLTTAA